MSANLRFSTNTVDGKKYLGGPLVTGANGIFSTSATAANLIFDEILKSENIAGTSDYRCLYLQNDFSNRCFGFYRELHCGGSSPTRHGNMGSSTPFKFQKIPARRAHPFHQPQSFF